MVRPVAGFVFDGSTKGNTPKAALVSMPTMNRQEARKAFQHSNRDCVPVQDSDLVTDQEIRPQRKEEIAAGVERYSPNDVPQRGSKEQRQQNAGASKQCIPKWPPRR